jgi:tetratricopeptide (TPR) repeat protein
MKHYEDRKEYVLKHTPSLWEYRRKLDDDKDETSLSVFTTWELSFQQISKNHNERTLIGQFLTFSAFLNTPDVGEDLFRSSLTLGNEISKWIQLFTSGGVWDQYKYEDIITELSNLSLLQRVATETTVLYFSLHPLVADWLKLRTDQNGREDFTIEAITILANYINNQDLGKLPFQVKQYLLAHIDACIHNDREYLRDTDKSDLASRRQSAITFAQYYIDLDRYPEAEALFQQALAREEVALGPVHESTLSTVNNLGVLYEHQGKLAEAEAMYQRALAGREKGLGLDHTSTLDIAKNLGLFYSKQGKLAEAEAIYQRALAGHEKVLSLDHTSTLDIVYSLGLLYSKQGKPAEAEAMYQRSVAGREKARA